MITRRRRFLASLAAILCLAPSVQLVMGQTGEPAKARVAPTAKIDPNVQRASAPIQGPGQAPGAPNAKPPAPIADPAAVKKMEELLRLWETKSKQVQSLDVKYTRYDTDPVFNVNKKFEGQAKLGRPDFVYLDFFEVIDGKPKAFDERIVCDGKDVYQFRGSTKQVFIYPLPKDQQAKALNQGALPFLFDMTVKKAKERYQMIFLREDETSYFIQIIPLLSIDREEYSQAAVQLSKDKLLPLAIKLWAPNNKETKRFSFAPASMISDRKIPPAWFDGAGMAAGLAKSGWKVVRNPDEQGQPGAAPGANRPPAGNPSLGARPANGAGNRPATKGQGAVKQR